MLVNIQVLALTETAEDSHTLLTSTLMMQTEFSSETLTTLPTIHIAQTPKNDLYNISVIYRVSIKYANLCDPREALDT
jgi:hypothetical protein